MGKKRFFSVGYRLPGAEVENIPFSSDRSLLDADVVLFEPSIGQHHSLERFQGKELLSESSSAKVPRQLDHWNAELKAVLEAGKLAVIFLAKPIEVFVHTGEKQHSGTGRNRLTTNIVRPVTSYSAVPYISVTAKSGAEMVPIATVGFFAPFWAEFREHFSSYEVWIEGKYSDILLRTRTGNKIVGAALRHGKGAMLFLPPLRRGQGSSRQAGEEATGEKRGLTQSQFGKKVVAALVALADALASEQTATPLPTWTGDSQYRMLEESALDTKILHVQQQIEKLQDQKRQLEQDRVQAGSLRRLLYEQGEPLEQAILEALRLMGFTAEGYKDGESEFDAVFTSPEGRFLGEAEGKDNRPINVEKYSQLERNLNEDYAREHVTEHAKGVLFGNGFRLMPPSERGEAFTEKCFSSARRTGVALVRTMDLFAPARYLKTLDDSDYARRCREAIFATKGEVVQFPAPPAEDAGTGQSDQERAGVPAG